MEAALLTMIAALFVAVLGSIYEQRREGAKTRDKLAENNEALRELATRTTVLEASHQHMLERFTELRQDFGEHRRVTDKNHAEVTGSLADARERLARIEGHMGIGLPPTNQTGS